MHYRALVLSLVIGVCFLEVVAMKKVIKKPSMDVSRAYAQATPQERKAIEALVEMGKAKEKPTNVPSSKKKAPQKTN